MELPQEILEAMKDTQDRREQEKPDEFFTTAGIFFLGRLHQEEACRWFSRRPEAADNAYFLALLQKCIGKGSDRFNLVTVLEKDPSVDQADVRFKFFRNVVLAVDDSDLDYPFEKFRIIAQRLRDGYARKNYVEEIRNGVKEGNPQAMFLYARLVFYWTDDLGIDEEEALSCFKSAADKGWPEAVEPLADGKGEIISQFDFLKHLD
jgi:hypothetical protein